MKAAALHLIETHGCNRILFIRGRRDSKEGEDRYLGFRHALREKGILNDERRVITGDFTKPGVLNAYAKLGDVAFDAVLSANDDMALALMGELTKQGRAVPRDVAVIGFDDVPEARLASVPLTSVAQPFDDLAKSAIVALDKELSHTVASSVSAVHAQLVVRQSCGCQPAS